jgi:hypothetical protein
MHTITLISTVHKENGKCNADELCTIIEEIRPEVIFLEALDETYSDYQKSLFSSFGVFHNKLEIKAIQKYCLTNAFVYIPVLDNGLAGSFDKKYSVVCENIEFQKLVDNFNFLSNQYGFQFLNSRESIKLQEELRMCESRLLIDNKINAKAIEDIDAYENSMLCNIFGYCRDNQFETAIFMCGVAHRKAIIEKIEKFNVHEKIELDWTIFGS